MNSSGTSARELLVSLVSEERRGRPGPAARAALAAADADAPGRAAHLLVAVYAAIAAGEPRQALRLLSDIGEPSNAAIQRRVRACRAWAQWLDRNWYPGDTGAEGGISKEGLTTVGEVFPGDPETTLVEACAAHGPAKILSVRSLLESIIRKSAGDATALLQSALGDLEHFKEIALLGKAPASACWAMQCQADLLHRSGNVSDAQHHLERVRELYAAGEDGIGVACTYLVQGDWWATPGSSPEALGLDLGGRPDPSPFADTVDAARAADMYHMAESAVHSADAPRVAGALALRRAVLSFLAGDLDEQSRWLEKADQAFADAGETSGRHLVVVHRLVRAVSGGDFVQLRREAPPEWGTANGPIADIAAWGAACGSLSFCTGLGRILERTAEQWEGRGDLDRAEFAYLMARPLLPLSGLVPERSVLLALTRLDSRRNLQVRAMVRRLRVLADLPPPRTDGTPIEWMQDLDLTLPLIDIPSGTIGTGPIAMRAIERGAERLSVLLGAAWSANASQRVSAMDSQDVLADLRKAWADYNPLEAVGQAEAPVSRVTQLALATTALIGHEQLARAKPQVSLLRGREAERLGWDAVADQWYQTALDQIESVGDANRWLGVLILGAWGRHEEARALFGRIRAGRMVEKTLLPSLALRARDFESARELFRELDAHASRGESSWIDFLDRAEAALECGDAAAALGPALRALESFENAIDRLPRDPDRVAACDDVKAAALYLVASRVHLGLADRHGERGDEAGRIGALGLAFSIADRGHTIALPRFASATAESTVPLEDRRKRWHQAATERSTAYERYLAALALGGNGPSASLADELSRTEQRLADIEANLGRAEYISLIEARRPNPLTLDETQSLLPAGVCLLEYHMVGRDLVAWGITNSCIHPWHQRLSVRPVDGAVRRLLRSCASGEAPTEADELARLLLDPFAEILAQNDRVIIVPFGPLHAAPFHVLPFCGEPLGATHVVSYLPAASLLRGTAVDRKLGDGGALIVGDPAFDPQLHPSLRRLPGAALEAGVIGRLYGTIEVFRAGDAREVVLLPLLRGRAVLHLAAHGRLDEIAPNTSSIVLAGSDQLTVSDLIGLHVDADLAILSACDTGRGALSLGGDLVGLTRGLLAAGVKRSVVSLWPVDDVAACVTMIAFHEKMLTGEKDPPALALAKAQREVRSMSGVALAARYGDLGGELERGRASTRRQSSEARWNRDYLRRLAPFPETDLDDAPARTLEESDGSLASIWAPFVLMGC